MSDPLLNQLFETRYRLDAVLGEGGFSTVYLATDVESGRLVAVKILKREHGGYASDIESRFHREVQVLAQLRSPHTVTLHDYGISQDGLLFMVFEHVPGQDLSQLLMRGPLAPSIVIHIMRQILQSLSEAHARGILHRDLKPENVRVFEFMNDAHHVKLLDFGIARPASPTQDAAITKADELVGTPRYMSPEQLVAGQLTAASDIYSLGLVAVQMVAGAQALQGPRLSDQFDRLLTGHVFDVEEYTRVGPGLRQVLLRMTARSVRDRYQSADEVIRALDAVIRGETDTNLLPPAQPTRTQSIEFEARPHPRSRITIAIVAAVLLTGVVVGIWALIRQRADDDQRARQAVLAQINQVPRPNMAVEQETLRPTSEPVEPSVDLGVEADVGSLLRSGCGLPPEQRDEGLPVYVPKGYDESTKHRLIVLLHQDGRNGEHILRQSFFDRFAEERGFLVAYPDEDASRRLVAWRQPGDVDRIRRLVLQIRQNLCVDDSQVFVVSHGASGALTDFLSCEEWIAGVATSGYRSQTNQFRCPSAPPKPSITLSPMNSKRMLVEGGTACLVFSTPIPLAEHEAMWLERNQCSSNAPRQFAKTGTGTCFDYACKRPYVSCHIDGGYGWAGNPAVPEHDGMRTCGDVPADFPGTETILRFFDSVSG